MGRTTAPRGGSGRLVTAALVILLAGCAAEGDPTSGETITPTSSPPPTSLPSTSAPEPTTSSSTSPTTPFTWPPFESTVAPVSTERLGPTWRAGCPVGADALRLVTITHATFEGTPTTGELIVAAEVVDEVVAAFGELYAARFPIRKMITMEAYDGDDERSGADDNTSGFNCRNVLGTDRWSQHSYGLAVDINPLENPYLVGGEVLPPAGAAYLDRTDVRPGMIVADDLVVRAFTSRGFEWGGEFVSTPDFQHFARPR